MFCTAKDSIKNLRRRIRGLQVQLAAGRHQCQERNAELAADALEAEEARLAMLIGRNLKRRGMVIALRWSR